MVPTCAEATVRHRRHSAITSRILARCRLCSPCHAALLPLSELAVCALLLTCWYLLVALLVRIINNRGVAFGKSHPPKSRC